MLDQLIPIFLITFSVFVLFFLFMNIGYMVNKRPLKGSCGGVANLMGDKNCQFCGDDPNKCGEINAENKDDTNNQATDLGKSIM